MFEQQSESADVLEDDVGDWPKGPYTQQIEGVLTTMLTEKLSWLICSNLTTD